ncbi:MAG: hypothetical protein PUF50_01970 [Erysipelotrichaceae bacterium]|nr:hypothetical protein [Erysipelotrichaceae bacterium]
MFKIYNKNALTRNERFQNALLVGILVTVAFTVLYGILCSFLVLELQLLYLAFGYGIGMAIQKAGRGVQPRFAILAAVCAFFCFFIGDLLCYFGFGILTNPSMWPIAIRFLIQIWLNVDLSSILSLLFRISGIYLAYQSARIA